MSNQKKNKLDSKDKKLTQNKWYKIMNKILNCKNSHKRINRKRFILKRVSIMIKNHKRFNKKKNQISVKSIKNLLKTYQMILINIIINLLINQWLCIVCLILA